MRILKRTEEKMNINKPLVFKSTLILLTLSVLGVLFFSKSSTPQLRINEISFAKNNGLDWIEIYNPSINSVSLKGFYFSDDRKNFQRFKIKDNIIVPNQGFAVIYGKELEEIPVNSTSLNFNIGSGETVYLISPEGLGIIDSMTAILPEKMNPGGTIGRFPDGGEELFAMSEGTPGRRNKKDFLFGKFPPMPPVFNDMKK